MRDILDVTAIDLIIDPKIKVGSLTLHPIVYFILFYFWIPGYKTLRAPSASLASLRVALSPRV